MAALTSDAFAALLKSGCPKCGRNYLRARAIAPGSFDFLDGEPASSVTWGYTSEELPGRLYRIDCTECSAVVWERDDCPGCLARGALSRVLEGRNGIVAPTICPRCDHSELRVVAEVRMHIDYTLGSLTRRVLDAEPHDRAFHVTRADCPSCEDTVARHAGGCVLCGRSSLLKKLN